MTNGVFEQKWSNLHIQFSGGLFITAEIQKIYSD